MAAHLPLGPSGDEVRLLEAVSILCSAIALGKLPAELREEYSSDQLKMSPEDMDKLTARLQSNGIAFTVIGQEAVVTLSRTLDALPVLKQCEDLLTGFEVINGSMDDAFIAITGKEIRE